MKRKTLSFVGVVLGLTLFLEPAYASLDRNSLKSSVSKITVCSQKPLPTTSAVKFALSNTLGICPRGYELLGMDSKTLAGIVKIINGASVVGFQNGFNYGAASMRAKCISSWVPAPVGYQAAPPSC